MSDGVHVITLRMPKWLHEELTKRARNLRRSFAQECFWRLERSVQEEVEEEDLAASNE